jgi:Putative gypsy type transposon
MSSSDTSATIPYDSNPSSSTSISTSSDPSLGYGNQALSLRLDPIIPLSGDSERTPSLDPLQLLAPEVDLELSESSSASSETDSPDDFKKNPIPYCHSITSAQQLWIFCHNVQLPPEYEARTALLSERACDPPLGYTAFYVSQFDAGLRFPIPPFMEEVSITYRIPLNQFGPNAIRDIIGFMAVSKYIGLPLSVKLFYSLFKPSQQGVGIWTLCPRLPTNKFLYLAPTNMTRWRNRFFFVKSQPSWRFPHKWVARKVAQLPFDYTQESAEFEARMNQVQTRRYDLSRIICPALLHHLGLTPSPDPSDDRDFGITSLSSLIFTDTIACNT